MRDRKDRRRAKILRLRVEKKEKRKKDGKPKRHWLLKYVDYERKEGDIRLYVAYIRMRQSMAFVLVFWCAGVLCAPITVVSYCAR